LFHRNLITATYFATFEISSLWVTLNDNRNSRIEVRFILTMKTYAKNWFKLHWSKLYI